MEYFLFLFSLSTSSVLGTAIPHRMPGFSVYFPRLSFEWARVDLENPFRRVMDGTIFSQTSLNLFNQTNYSLEDNSTMYTDARLDENFFRVDDYVTEHVIKINRNPNEVLRILADLGKLFLFYLVLTYSQSLDLSIFFRTLPRVGG